MFGYIVANKWLRANYGNPLRRWLKTQHIEEIIDFGDLPVFEQATTYPCILRVRAGTIPAETFRVTLAKTLEFKGLDEYVFENAFDLNQQGLLDNGWMLVKQESSSTLDKLRKVGKPLEEYVNKNIFRGVLTGLNEAFVIDAETRKNLITADLRSVDVIKRRFK
jgi:hypothetical protein